MIEFKTGDVYSNETLPNKLEITNVFGSMFSIVRIANKIDGTIITDAIMENKDIETVIKDNNMKKVEKNDD